MEYREYLSRYYVLLCKRNEASGDHDKNPLMVPFGLIYSLLIHQVKSFFPHHYQVNANSRKSFYSRTRNSFTLSPPLNGKSYLMKFATQDVLDWVSQGHVLPPLHSRLDRINEQSSNESHVKSFDHVEVDSLEQQDQDPKDSDNQGSQKGRRKRPRPKPLVDLEGSLVGEVGVIP